jgi:hypothetical protein
MPNDECITMVLFWGANGSDGELWKTTPLKDSATLTGWVDFDWDGVPQTVPGTSIKRSYKMPLPAPVPVPAAA